MHAYLYQLLNSRLCTCWLEEVWHSQGENCSLHLSHRQAPLCAPNYILFSYKPKSLGSPKLLLVNL